MSVEPGWELCRHACLCAHCACFAWRLARAERLLARERFLFAVVLSLWAFFDVKLRAL